MKEVERERRKVQITCLVTLSQPVLKCEDFSSWRELLQVTAYVFILCLNVRVTRLPARNEETKEGPLMPREIGEVELYWLKIAQIDLRQKMERGDFKMLTPFRDEKGLIRVGGRVDPCLLSYNNGHPVLLPHKHCISKLITREAHQFGHSEVAATTAKTQRKFWIIKGHDISKDKKYQCTFW